MPLLNRLKSNPILLYSFVSGILVFYFLYFLEAYGIQQGISASGHNHLVRSLSFGVLTSLYLYLFENFLRPALPQLSKGHALVAQLLSLLIGIQLIFVLFNYFWNWQELDLQSYLLIAIEFPMLMAIPMLWYEKVLLAPTYSQNKKEVSTQKIKLVSSNTKDQLLLNSNDFLWAKSADNYLEIYFRSGAEIQMKMIRKTMKELRQELKDFSHIGMVHRSYLVNLSQVDHWIKESQKSHVLIGQHTLPVSKSHMEQVARILQEV